MRTVVFLIDLLWRAARKNFASAFAVISAVILNILVGRGPSITSPLFSAALIIFAMFKIWQEMSASKVSDHPSTTKTIRALKNFFSRAWFRRTWIIQEIGASQDAVLLCGAREIPWASLRTAASQIEHLINIHPRRSPYLDSGFQALAFMSSVLDVKIRLCPWS